MGCTLPTPGISVGAYGVKGHLIHRNFKIKTEWIVQTLPCFTQIATSKPWYIQLSTYLVQ